MDKAKADTPTRRHLDVHSTYLELYGRQNNSVCFYWAINANISIGHQLFYRSFMRTLLDILIQVNNNLHLYIHKKTSATTFQATCCQSCWMLVLNTANRTNGMHFTSVSRTPNQLTKLQSS